MFREARSSSKKSLVTIGHRSTEADFCVGQLSFKESGSFGSPLMYTVKMGVLIPTRIDGKVKQARYESSPRAIEPIYSLLGFIFIVLLTREQERVSGIK